MECRLPFTWMTKMNMAIPINELLKGLRVEITTAAGQPPRAGCWSSTSVAFVVNLMSGDELPDV